MNHQNDNFLPVFDDIPPLWEDARSALTEHLKRIGNVLNNMDNGSHVDEETLTGQKFVPGTGKDGRGILRKVVKIGALPNAAIKNVAHGITTTANTAITRIYGAATDHGAASLTSAIPLPYVDMTAGGQNIELKIDGTNVIITTNADYTAYTDAYVVIEYVQEA